MAVERAKEALAMMRVCVETANNVQSSEQQFDHLQMASFWAQIYFVEQRASEIGREWRDTHPSNDGANPLDAVQ